MEYEEQEKDYFQQNRCLRLEGENTRLQELIDGVEIELIQMNKLRVQNEKLSAEVDKCKHNEQLLIAERNELIKEINRLKKSLRERG